MSHIRVCSLMLVIMSIETADKKKKKKCQSKLDILSCSMTD